jgi:hypothetical protein
LFLQHSAFFEGRDDVETVVQNMINGIMMGCIYGLIALGLSMIFGVMNIVNFAHGDFVMLSMYLTFWVSSLMSVDTVATIAFTLPLLFIDRGDRRLDDLTPRACPVDLESQTAGTAGFHRPGHYRSGSIHGHALPTFIGSGEYCRDPPCIFVYGQDLAGPGNSGNL